MMNNESIWYLLEELYKVLSNNEKVKMFFDTSKKLRKKPIQFDKVKFVEAFNDNLIIVSKFSAENDKVFELCNKILLKSEKEKNYLTDFNLEIPCFMKLVYTLAMLVIYCAVSFEEKTLYCFKDEKLYVKAHKNHYYRGQSDYSFGMLPSMFRKCENNNIVLTGEDIREKYNKLGLAELYNKIFIPDNDDLKFLSFMQHSKSYSPLLDFTEEPIVALSFATNNKNMNIESYNTIDAAFFDLELNSYSEQNKIQNKFSFQDMRIEIFNKKINVNTKINNKPIYYCTVNDFVPEVFIINKKDNDRMKYQKGDFLVFKRCVFVNGIPLIPLGFGKLTKYKIHSKENNPELNKTKIYKNIKSEYKHYDYDHLMNPYLIFEELI